MQTFHPNQTFRDLTGHWPEPVTTDENGEAEFRCPPGKRERVVHVLVGAEGMWCARGSAGVLAMGGIAPYNSASLWQTTQRTTWW